MLLLSAFGSMVMASTPLAVPTRPVLPRPDSALPAWQIDVANSEIGFSVRHLLVERVRGKFTKWAGTIRADPSHWNTASVSVTVQAASISTDEDKRDAHLRSSAFFDVEKFPTITFVSTKVIPRGDSVTVLGNLTMHGVTKPVVLAGKLAGMRRTKTGKNQATFTATTTLNRFDYGIAWNDLNGAGVVLVGKDVTVDIKLMAEQQ